MWSFWTKQLNEESKNVPILSGDYFSYTHLFSSSFDSLKRILWELGSNMAQYFLVHKHLSKVLIYHTDYRNGINGKWI